MSGAEIIRRLQAFVDSLQGVIANESPGSAGSEPGINERSEAVPGAFSRHLLPCPFCNGSVSFDDEECWKRGIGFYIECSWCSVQMWAQAYGNDQLEDPDMLAKRWNDRAGSRPAQRQGEGAGHEPRK